MKKTIFFVALATCTFSFNSYAQNVKKEIEKIKNLEDEKNSVPLYDNDPLCHRIDSLENLFLCKGIEEVASIKDLKEIYRITAKEKRIEIFQKIIDKCKDISELESLGIFVKNNNFPGYSGRETYLLLKKKVDFLFVEYQKSENKSLVRK